MMRAYYQWQLDSEEAYVRALRSEGWAEHELSELTKKCEALRVSVALTPPLDREDVIVLWACALCAVVLGVLLCL